MMIVILCHRLADDDLLKSEKSLLIRLLCAMRGG
jgi:hypothetical protein